VGLVKTSKKLEIGDEILVFQTEDEYIEFDERKEQAQKEVRALPQGQRYIIFLMKKNYRESYSPNTKILYKRTVREFDPMKGIPKYKDHNLTFIGGRIKTSNYEEIAFLDMHKKWFIRETERELTPLEKAVKEKDELAKKLEELQKQLEVKEVKPENQVTIEEVKQNKPIEENKEIVENIKPKIEEKKAGKRGRPRKS
jgi:MFS superfamily sulfate permease-like transporter